MTIKECILENFKKMFNNVGIPCNEFFKASVKEYIGIECEILERTKTIMVIKLLFSDEPMTIRCTFRETENVTKFISNIELIN